MVSVYAYFHTHTHIYIYTYYKYKHVGVYMIWISNVGNTFATLLQSRYSSEAFMSMKV